LHIFIQHTSASLAINENADPDVAADLQRSLDRLAPEDFPYRHTCEGPDDMPAHVKTALTDTSLSVPVRNGRLALGTWQGIFLCEHRRRASGRLLVLTLNGQREV
jgi:secondary thiamine-phosphate synthase enzyme